MGMISPYFLFLFCGRKHSFAKRFIKKGLERELEENLKDKYEKKLEELLVKAGVMEEEPSVLNEVQVLSHHYSRTESVIIGVENIQMAEMAKMPATPRSA